MKFIDKFLNSITMYKLVLYGLMAVALFAVVFGFVGWVPFGGGPLLLSVVILWIFAWASNKFFAWLFKAPTNSESYAITAMILFFIMTPVQSLHDFYILVIAAVIAMASKYILAVHKRHVFNPAAITALIFSLFGVGAASWWIATPYMLPIVLIVGLLIVRKIRRFTMFWTFVVTSLVVMLISFSQYGLPWTDILTQAILSFPIIFFGTVMLTEPLTTPPRRSLQVTYAIVVGILFSIEFHFGPVNSSPELALIIGNVFSYLVSLKRRMILTLKERNELSSGVHEFVFTTNDSFDYTPGQYLEWTLEHNKTDIRGNRRYFTISSSPTEKALLKIGVRVQKDGSSFKDALVAMKPGDVIAAGALGGEFVLPQNQTEKLAFIAGGIGVTPFRSMVKYLTDRGEKRDVAMFYAAMSEADFVYKDIFDRAAEVFGFKLIKIATDAAKVSEAWKGKTGFLTKELIAAEVPDYKDRTFYLSGPDPMVQNYKRMLLGMGVSRTRIHTDYFPGF